ncbi:right-handed parallel beta-helix repeat-containing protein, partial [Candidatus Micrarchaeota archaeon]|nr:right-handed parallel beta-helix repeat-containing protein [Candidatus Micrarchaeota archaeon]
MIAKQFLLLLVTGLVILSVMGCVTENKSVTVVESTVSGPTARVNYKGLTLYGGGKVVEVNVPAYPKTSEFPNLASFSSGVMSDSRIIDVANVKTQVSQFEKVVNATKSSVTYNVGDLLITNTMESQDNILYAGGNDNIKHSLAVKNNGGDRNVTLYFKHVTKYHNVYANGKVYHLSPGERKVFTSSDIDLSDIKILTANADKLFLKEKYNDTMFSENEVEYISYPRITFWSGDVAIGNKEPAYSASHKMYSYDWNDIAKYSPVVYVVSTDDSMVVYTFVNVHLGSGEMVSFDPSFILDDDAMSPANGYYLPSTASPVASVLCDIDNDGNDEVIILRRKMASGPSHGIIPSPVSTELVVYDLPSGFPTSLNFNRTFDIIHAGNDRFDKVSAQFNDDNPISLGCYNHKVYTGGTNGVYVFSRVIGYNNQSYNIGRTTNGYPLFSVQYYDYGIGAIVCNSKTGECSHSSTEFSEPPWLTKVIQFNGNDYIAVQFTAATDPGELTGSHYYLTYFAPLPLHTSFLSRSDVTTLSIGLQYVEGQVLRKGDIVSCDVLPSHTGDEVLVSVPSFNQSTGLFKTLTDLPHSYVSLHSHDYGPYSVYGAGSGGLMGTSIACNDATFMGVPGDNVVFVMGGDRNYIHPPVPDAAGFGTGLCVNGDRLIVTAPGSQSQNIAPKLFVYSLPDISLVTTVSFPETYSWDEESSHGPKTYSTELYGMGDQLSCSSLLLLSGGGGITYFDDTILKQEEQPEECVDGAECTSDNDCHGGTCVITGVCEIPTNDKGWCYSHNGVFSSIIGSPSLHTINYKCTITQQGLTFSDCLQLAGSVGQQLKFHYSSFGNCSCNLNINCVNLTKIRLGTETNPNITYHSNQFHVTGDVTLCPGTYTENDNTNDGKGIIIFDNDGIDFNGNGAIIREDWCYPGSILFDVSHDNILIHNLNITQYSQVLRTTGDNTTFTGNTVSDNGCQNGPVIYYTGLGTNGELTNNMFDSNTASLVVSLAGTGMSFNLSHNTFEHNGCGKVLFINGSYKYVYSDNNLFKLNNAQYTYLYDGGNTVYMTNDTILNNSEYGLALYSGSIVSHNLKSCYNNQSGYVSSAGYDVLDTVSTGGFSDSGNTICDSSNTGVCDQSCAQQECAHVDRVWVEGADCPGQNITCHAMISNINGDPDNVNISAQYSLYKYNPDTDTWVRVSYSFYEPFSDRWLVISPGRGFQPSPSPDVSCWDDDGQTICNFSMNTMYNYTSEGEQYRCAFSVPNISTGQQVCTPAELATDFDITTDGCAGPSPGGACNLSEMTVEQCLCNGYKINESDKDTLESLESSGYGFGYTGSLTGERSITHIIDSNGYKMIPLTSEDIETLGTFNIHPTLQQLTSINPLTSEPYYLTSNHVHYILCDDLYSESTVFNLSGAQDVIIDCQGHQVKNKLGKLSVIPGIGFSTDETYAFNINNSKDINVLNCNVQSIESLPLYRYGYSLLLTGSSDNITIKDSNISWKVKIDNSGENEFENVRFEY